MQCKTTLLSRQLPNASEEPAPSISILSYPVCVNSRFLYNVSTYLSNYMASKTKQKKILSTIPEDLVEN